MNLFKYILPLVLCSLTFPSAAGARDAGDIVKAAFDHYRGDASVATLEMVIHRPSWQRSITINAWTKGTSQSLIRVSAPAKDRDNGTLKNARDMWTYNPKVNRVIKLPPSLMSQSWMGSDFSNDDLAKTDSILKDYTHTRVGTEHRDGHTVYKIKSMPKPGAPVVWGMQIFEIRDDDVMLSEAFFDEDLQPVKKMTAENIQTLGGRILPRTWKMREQGLDDQYTLIRYQKLEFPRDLPDHLFTVQELKTPRRR